MSEINQDSRSSELPWVRELVDVPPANSNTQGIDVLVVGNSAVLTYAVASIHKWRGKHACIEFQWVLKAVAGAPNDEALQNHPLFKSGLRYYQEQEVVNSPWIDEQLMIADRFGKIDPARRAKCRHFVFSLKEDTFECIAEGYRVHGPFDRLQEARAHATNLAWE